MNTPPEIQPGNNDRGVQRQRELESTGATFSWDNDRDAFVGGCDDIKNQDLYKLIQGASVGLGKKLADNNKRRFEIHPAKAVKK